jgi:hypothetical protein
MNEFARHLHDTVILLGGRRDIAEMLLRPELIDESAVDTLRQYNIDLLELVKDRLANINKSEVQVSTSGSGKQAYSFRMSLP